MASDAAQEEVAAVGAWPAVQVFPDLLSDQRSQGNHPLFGAFAAHQKLRVLQVDILESDGSHFGAPQASEEQEGKQGAVPRSIRRLQQPPRLILTQTHWEPLRHLGEGEATGRVESGATGSAKAWLRPAPG